MLTHGWRQEPLPTFDFGVLRLVDCHLCFCDGAGLFRLLVRTSDEMKEKLLEGVRTMKPRHASATLEQITNPMLFDWGVSVWPEGPTLIHVYQPNMIRPSLTCLFEMAESIHKDKVLHKGCPECKAVIAGKHDHIEVCYLASSIGDCISWVCPECGEKNLITNDDF